MAKGESVDSRPADWEDWVIRKIGLRIFGIEEEAWLKKKRGEVGKDAVKVLDGEKAKD